MEKLFERFKTKYAHLEKKGIVFRGLAEVDAEKRIKVIVISKPFVFDSRLIPEKFEGVRIRRQIHGRLPKEFKIKRYSEDGEALDYIWAPERFEKFVDRKFDSIKERLGDMNMTRDEVLDALCFGDFKAHKAKVEKLIQEGKVPPYQD